MASEMSERPAKDSDPMSSSSSAEAKPGTGTSGASSSSIPIPDAELTEMYDFAITLGREAGQMLLDSLHGRRRDGHSTSLASASNGGDDETDDQPLEMQEKLNAVDIVTATDTLVENFIHSRIRARYPTHEFIGEETYSSSTSTTSSSKKEYLVRDETPTWVVDPLDGTVNFTHGFPMFCVSVALVHGGRPVVGVVCAPMLGLLLSACRGRGAFMHERDGTPTQTRTRLPLLGDRGVGPIPASAPRGCIFSCEWGKDRRDTPDGTGNLQRKVDSFVNMASEPAGRGGLGGMVHGVRSLGSATLDLAYTAMGVLDVWWEGGCWEWDVAAGICLLVEAGGLVTTANPPEDWETCVIPDVKLGGRLYLAVRPARDAFDGSETARQGQERLVREVWKRVRSLDYHRPGA